MKTEVQLLREVLESATRTVQRRPLWRRSDEVRRQLVALKHGRKTHRRTKGSV